MPRRKVLLDPVKSAVVAGVSRMRQNGEEIRTQIETASILLRASVEKIPLTSAMLSVIQDQRKAVEILDHVLELMNESREENPNGTHQGDEQAQADGQ